MSRVSVAIIRATAVVSQAHAQTPGSIEWQYHVRIDDANTGVASPVVAGADGAIYLGTTECVYDMRSMACVNATGELVKLDSRTGGEEWSVRFDGAGLTGTLGFPRAPALVGDPSGKDSKAIVVGGETLHPFDTTFYYFAGSVPLGADSVSCDVPLASGNRMPHEVSASTADECTGAGGCWTAEGEDVCALTGTAQTHPCNDVDNPVDEDACAAKGCCFNSAYSPGWCFRASPSCYKPAPAAHSVQQTSRPGPLWISKPVPSESGHIVVMADCSEYWGLASECGVGAYKTEGGPPLWRVPLLASCDNGGAAPCMCPVAQREVPPPVVSHDAAYVVACSSEGVVLLGLSLETGEQLWPQQLLVAHPLHGNFVNLPPSPVWSSEHGMVYAAAFTGGDVAKVSAHSASSGEMVWSTEVGGHSCGSLSWLEVTAVVGATLLLWDNFTLRALEAPSGKPMWETSSIDFSVVLGSGVPTVLPDSVLLPISYKDPTCSTMTDETFYFAELALSDGALRGRVEAPEGLVPADATNLVSAGGLWVFSSTPGYPQKSVVFAIKPPAVDSTIVM